MYLERAQKSTRRVWRRLQEILNISYFLRRTMTRIYFSIIRSHLKTETYRLFGLNTSPAKKIPKDVSFH